MAELVYVLCGLTSAACATLLVRSYFANRSRLLLWSSICFLGLALNNALVFVDKVTSPEIDLSVHRSAIALISMLILVFGLIWDAP
jgi:hypothetical protein